MGNNHSASPPEAFMSLVQDNKHQDVQRMLARLPRAEKKELLESRNRDGHTCLLSAVIRGHLLTTTWLLQNGADVNAMTKSGTALHEAAARKNFAIVELLMLYGADPFLASPKGETALELAVLAGSLKIVRRFDQEALFAGDVEMMPSLQRERRQLWVLSDRKSLIPKCRMWLDGASSYLAAGNGLEAILRLHQSHSQPTGNAFTRFCSGYCLFLKAPSLRAPAAASQANQAIDDVQTRWLQLHHSCHLVGVSANSPAPSMPNMAAFLERGAATGSPMPIGSLPPPPLNHTRASLPNPEFSLDGGSMTMMTFPAGSTVSTPGNRTPAMGTPLRSSAPSDPFHAALLQQRLAAAAMGGGGGSSSARVPLEGIHAWAGESDRDYAARIAAIMLAEGGGGGGSMGFLGHRPPLPPSAAGYGMMRSSVARSSSASGNVSSSAFSGASPSVSSGGLPATLFSSSGGGSSAGPSMGSSSGGGGGGGSVDYSDCCAPSAPPLPSAPMRASMSAFGMSAGEEAESCVICLSAAPDAGFLHGATVHRCVCSACSRRIKVGDRCPMCREKVERVINCY